MRLGEIFVIFILLAALGGLGYFTYLNLPIGDLESASFNSDIDFNISGNTQFYPNMRYSDREITYSIDELCNLGKEKNIREAFKIIESKTVLNFERVSKAGQISILCSEIEPNSENEGHFVAGEGGPTEVVDAGNFNVIFSGKVSLFRTDNCDNPQIAIHEILHALGFDHNNNQSSIMYPVTSCNQVIDDYIIEEINEIYESESVPDLVIDKVDASKIGKYLDFKIVILNAGLKESNGFSLKLYSNGDFVKSFEIDGAEVGTRRILEAENVKLSGLRDNIIGFEISLNQDELSKENNYVELVVE